MPGGDDSMDGQPHALYAQAHAARRQARLLAGQLHASRRKAQENWQLIQAAWDRTEQIRARRRAAYTDPDWLRYSAYARLQARLATMPVIEQAKGILMAQYGWPEDQAFDALRRVSQRKNIKVRDLAASIVARTARPAPAPRPRDRASAATQSGGELIPWAGSGGSWDRPRASA
jgi:hypothetical protein